MLELMWKEKAKRAKKNQKGFTLVELIVVVAILGILAVIGITRFSGLTNDARAKADISTAASIASAAQVWIADQDTKVTTAPTMAELKTANLIEDDTAEGQYVGGVWKVNYDGKTITVDAGSNEWYPAPDKATYENYQ